jgi:hypothetical protein
MPHDNTRYKLAQEWHDEQGADLVNVQFDHVDPGHEAPMFVQMSRATRALFDPGVVYTWREIQDRLTTGESHRTMAICDCCQRNEGTVRKWDTIPIGTSQGVIERHIPAETLCDTCNDGRFPYYGPTGIGTMTCPHDVQAVDHGTG